MLLRRMADFQPELVARAYGAIRATRADYLAAHNRWQSLLRSSSAPQGLSLYEAVLGPPEGEREEAVGDVTLTKLTWPLTGGLWPDLRWELMVGFGGLVLNGWLVRAPDARVPSLPAVDRLDRLEPWSCVVGDVLARYPAARQADPGRRVPLARLGARAAPGVRPRPAPAGQGRRNEFRRNNSGCDLAHTPPPLG